MYAKVVNSGPWMYWRPWMYGRPWMYAKVVNSGPWMYSVTNGRRTVLPVFRGRN